AVPRPLERRAPPVDFELDADQVELQRVVRDVVERECPAVLVRAVLAGGDEADGLWKTYVQLDWPSLTVPADDGGMGATAVELAITLEELGRAADPAPPPPAGPCRSSGPSPPATAAASCWARCARAAPAPPPTPRTRRGPGGTATAGCSTAPPTTSSTATGPTSWRWWPAATRGRACSS